MQQFLSKFTNGQKGTAISDCEVYIEMQDGTLAEIKKMELQESRLIGKMNSSAAWRVVVKGEPKHFIMSTSYKKQNPLGVVGEPSGDPATANQEGGKMAKKKKKKKKDKTKKKKNKKKRKQCDINVTLLHKCHTRANISGDLRALIFFFVKVFWGGTGGTVLFLTNKCWYC